ncbi:acyl-CoA-binding protein (ACBP)/diazepam binding inhibitor (DBI)/endozepine (EP) [Amphichorda felina]
MAGDSAAFKTAVEDSKKLVSKPNNDELLRLYALYKIANAEDITKAPAPGMFDLKASSLPLPREPPSNPPLWNGKAKKNAWQQGLDEGLTPAQAEEQYVALVEKLKVSCGYDANKDPEAVGS